MLPIYFEKKLSELGYSNFEKIDPASNEIYKARLDKTPVLMRLGLRNRFEGAENPWTLGVSQVLTEKIVSELVSHEALVKVLNYHEIPIQESDIIGTYPPLPKDGLLKVLIREYINGRELKKGEKIIDQINQKRLSSLVNLFHENGIAIRDLGEENIIKSLDGLMYVADVGICIFKEKVRPAYFNYEKKMDLEDLDCLFGN